VTDLDNNTQQNTALVEESAAATASLSDQAGKLMAVIAHFRIDRHPAAAVSTLAARATPARYAQRHEQIRERQKALAS
jgi:methyl-accepting chemotaxis protein